MRYWLAMLRCQQALAVRPEARSPVTLAASAINVQEPTSGQDYAKLGYAGREAFLVDRRGETLVELSHEWWLFFEDWLSTRYRRGADEDTELEQLVFYPTLRLSRGRLGGLLRFPVELEWHDGDRPFVVSSYAERRKQRFSAPPDRVRLKQPTEEAPGALPFFIDLRILTDVLLLHSERVDECLAVLRARKASKPRDTVWALCRLIEQQVELDRGLCEPQRPRPPSGFPEEGEKPEALLSRLQETVTERLMQIRSTTQAFALALVVSGDRSRSTWHLERDITAGIDLWQDGKIGSRSPLVPYLTGRPESGAVTTCWGRWRGAALTESQRVAGELALGSRCSAVQGPPGTGKTTLILNLLAHALVLKVNALEKSGTMGAAIMVVSSTNNRAVDNVVDPLGRYLNEEHLALSLRVGSRQVVERVTLHEFERARDWLEARRIPDDRAEAALKSELERFRVLRSEIENELAAERSYQKSLERKNYVEKELDRLAPESGDVSSEPNLRTALLEWVAPGHGDAEDSVRLSAPLAAIDRFINDPSRHALARTALGSFARRLAALSERAGTGESARDLTGVVRHWKHTCKRQLTRLESQLGFELRRFLPPGEDSRSLEHAFEAWEDGAETALLAVRQVEQALVDTRPDRHRARRRALDAELETLRAATAERPPAPDSAARERQHGQHRELFESAVRAREAWASRYRKELLDALSEAIQAARATRSLRALMQGHRPAARWLLQLFPAWGCTLLSLGNVFPAEPGSFEMAVIDEAGQCHPAYAIAALLRAKAALVIGDVNQLEPVIGLSADDERRIARGLELTCSPAELKPYRVHDGSMTSAQSLADRAVATRPTLIDHFRCQPAIAAISEALCRYGLVVHTPPRTRSDLEPALTDAVLHTPVDGAQERFAGSWVNPAELEVVLAWIVRLLNAGIPAADLGVITPFRGQLEQLWRRLRREGIALERPSSDAFDTETVRAADTVGTGLAVGTVHRFQGGERSIILFTACVTRASSLPFLNERVNLVNVAASRAREHLITIGHTQTLSQGRCTRHLVEGVARLRW